MPTIAEQRATALAQFRLAVQPNVQPQLGNEDLDALLDATARASIWTLSTAYSFGDVILPTVRNGHSYKCIVAGTAGATEPTWPKTDLRTITDGSSDPVLTWQENGPDFSNVYDVRMALHEACMLRAKLTAPLHSTKQSQSGYELQQIHEHWLKLAEKYAPLLIG